MPTSTAKRPNTAKTTTKKPASTGSTSQRPRQQPKRPTPPPRQQANRSPIATTTPIYDQEWAGGEDVDDQPLVRVASNSTPLGTIHTAAARLAGDESLRNKTPEPDPDWDDEDVVCVTVGYGNNDDNSQGFLVGNTPFDKNRIARDVPYAAARAMQKSYQPKSKKGGPNPCRIHPNDATIPEIARRCGVRPGDLTKLAAQLVAAINLDPDAFLNQFGEDDLLLIAQRVSEKALALRN